ncbi:MULTISPECIES: hypothetical protein [unclassified Streptomyces]|uniref:hypothetical protein n=1 Tax=unclassified Streptomyces TaxID=2593676 RepID=UPI002ED4FA33|nr:hypothetical protein OH827_32210 [Streptomyces sp. NBC_00891]WSY09417.1 hypothetical protein OG464_32215 [Streptomyces sp. NBC_00890]WSZ11038.1 hypothetical protein OG704_32220 [Streptomyces sp. NBC_00869]WSZ21457.1 hypothetical protein OG498_01350 [Streptomyces sp. NBC_00870]
MNQADTDNAAQSVQRVYAERFATDLADNRAEQKELAAQIERLRSRLERLRTDETWLAGMQSALPGATAPPRPRRAARAGRTRTGGGDTAAKAVPSPRTAGRTKPKPAGTKAAGRKAGTTAAAPLHQLIRALMPLGEPRLVREVHAELTKAHPERGTSVQVVRNTLETLVKRGVVGKGLQKGAAMYTATEAAQTDEGRAAG